MTGRFYFIFFRTHYVETRERESLEYSAAAEGKWPKQYFSLAFEIYFFEIVTLDPLRFLHVLKCYRDILSILLQPVKGIQKDSLIQKLTVQISFHGWYVCVCVCFNLTRRAFISLF